MFKKICSTIILSSILIFSFNCVSYADNETEPVTQVVIDISTENVTQNKKQDSTEKAVQVATIVSTESVEKVETEIETEAETASEANFIPAQIPPAQDLLEKLINVVNIPVFCIVVGIIIMAICYFRLKNRSKMDIYEYYEELEDIEDEDVEDEDIESDNTYTKQ